MTRHGVPRDSRDRFSVHDIGEAGKRLDELLEVAEVHGLDTRSIELSTAHGTPVTLPAVGPVART